MRPGTSNLRSASKNPAEKDVISGESSSQSVSDFRKEQVNSRVSFSAVV